MTPLNIPEQTPLYRAIHDKRYNRQNLIKEIEEITGRKLIIYISNIHHYAGHIDRDDIAPFGDLLSGFKNEDIDLFIHSPGGDIDTSEKIVYMCRSKSKSFRVIVPECAKSAATLIALSADSIVMSYTSELGPIDPQITITTADGKLINRPAQSFLDGLQSIKEETAKEGVLSPVYFPLLAHLDPALIDFCNKTKDRAKQFAIKWLKNYMCKDDEKKAQKIADELSNVKKYLSHGMVIDSKEAKKIGLSIEELEPESDLWKALWGLYCKYLVDMSYDKLVKVFESSRVSISYPG